MSLHKTLVLHVGDHKTGSTSIQLAFAQNLVKLEGKTVFYPAPIASNVLADHCARFAEAKTAAEKEKASVPFRKLADKIRSANSDFVLISAEALEGTPPVLLQEVVDSFFADCVDEIKVIAYVRPHAGRITSSFSERLKIGSPLVLEDTLESFAKRKARNGEFIYHPRFTAWKKIFGSRFVLRPMIRSQLHQSDVLSDFIVHAFDTTDFTVRPSKNANESLGLQDLMRLKILQQTINGPQLLRLRLGWEFARVLSFLPTSPETTKLRPHKSLAQSIQKRYLKDAREMDRTFFDGQPLMEKELSKAVDSAIAQPQSTDPADYFSASEVHSLRLMSGIIASLLEEPEVNWPAFLHRKRIRDVKKERARHAS